MVILPQILLVLTQVQELLLESGFLFFDYFGEVELLQHVACLDVNQVDIRSLVLAHQHVRSRLAILYYRSQVIQVVYIYVCMHCFYDLQVRSFNVE